MRPILAEVFIATVALGSLNCSGNEASTRDPQTGGAQSNGGTTSAGGSATALSGGESGVPHSGGAAGANGSGGAATGGAAAGGKAAGGAAAGGKAAGGSTADGGKSTGGGFGLGGSASGGRANSTGGANTTTGGAGGGAAGGATAGGSGTTDVDCNAMMPTDGKTYTGSSVNGNINGMNYGIWTNGSGGSITVFSNAHAFSTAWDNSQNFLAHLGLDFNTAKPYTAYGTIQAQFVEIKKGTAGSFSNIGMYGWMHNPCIEWYINEDAFNGLYGRGDVTATIDGATYYLSTKMTTGTDGANACESGHTGSWTQMISTRKTARQCGAITVSDHFAAWANQGWTLGTLSFVHINIEVGGGTGSIDFPVANVTTTSK